MAILRWTPVRGVLNFRDEMDRLMSDFLGSMPIANQESRGDWVPAMDVADKGGELVASVELPGLKREDIKVNVENSILTVSGEKKQERFETKEGVYRTERSYGCFERRVALPTAVDTAKVRAAFKDGVLTVTMPKHESKKAKEIPVEVS